MHTILDTDTIAALAAVPGVVILDADQDETLSPGEHSAAWDEDGAWMVARGVPSDAEGDEGLPALPTGLVWVCIG